MPPPCRMPPPKALRARRASRMVSSVPASREPTGAPRPLEEQTETVSAWLHHSRAGMPVAAWALESRAPSRGTLRPFSFAAAGGPVARLGIEEPGPVEVDLEALLLRHGGDRREVLQRVDCAAGGVVGVL